MQRMINYIGGAVRIKVSGAVPEKFINLCLAQNIFLWGIVRNGDDLHAFIRLRDFFRIRPVARKSRTRVTADYAYGLPFAAKRLRRRKMLVAGAALFIVLLHILSSYIWFIDVAGVKTVSEDRIKAVVFRYGLKPGQLKNNINQKTVETGLLLDIPELAWVSVNFTGTRAMVEVVEKTFPKQEDKSPANIVASKDGVITEIIVITGQPAVKKGDTVKKGDLLIKGFLPETAQTVSPGENPIITAPGRLVRANGIVKARVWYESYGEARRIQEYYQRTGNRAVAVSLKLGSQEISLKKADPIPYSLFEKEVRRKKLQGWRNSDFTVESTIEVYHELSSCEKELTAEEAKDAARGKALDGINDRIPEGAQIMSRNIELLPSSDPELVRVKVSIETIEDIINTVNITK